MDEQPDLTPEEEVQPVEENTVPEEQRPAYVPRPVWQVWLARVGLVLFVSLIIMYYINMMRGG